MSGLHTCHGAIAVADMTAESILTTEKRLVDEGQWMNVGGGLGIELDVGFNEESDGGHGGGHGGEHNVGQQRT